MNSSEKYVGSKEEFYFFLKDEVIKLFKEKLKIDGTRVLIPDYEKLDYEFNYVKDKDYGEFSIVVAWGKKPQDKQFSEEDIQNYLQKKFQEDIHDDINGDSSMVIDKILTMD